MSDFIKVNFKSGHIAIMHKDALHLHQAANKLFYANDANSYLAMLATIFSCSEEGRLDVFFGMNSAAEITREEYDRLCKELGVE